MKPETINITHFVFCSSTQRDSKNTILLVLTGLKINQAEYAKITVTSLRLLGKHEDGKNKIKKKKNRILR